LFIKELLKANPGNISSIFLFGSLVKNKVNKESDIDMMIFTKQPKKISEKDYQNPPSYFVWQVVEKGEKIF
jgi:predicted nucleotidyltransferase